MKTVLAIVIAGVLFGFNYVAGVSLGDGYCYVAGLFAVLGHNWPIYYKFKGGKGVLATASMALILSPLPFLIVFAIFVLIVWASRYVSLGSVTAAMLYPVAFVGYIKFKFPGAQMPGLISLSLIILAILIVFRHLGNLQRIGDRTERKLSFGKKKDKEDNE
jgi:glycerol-3-phosphate acyltransferase PlsY